MSKTLELPDDLAQLLDTPQKQTAALAYLRERFSELTDPADDEATEPIVDHEAIIQAA